MPHRIFYNIEIRNITIGNADNILLLCIIFCDLLLGSAVPINIDISVRSRESYRLNEFRRFCAPRLKFVELTLFRNGFFDDPEVDEPLTINTQVYNSNKCGRALS